MSLSVIEFEQIVGAERRHHRVKWPTVPRVGDSVDLDQSSLQDETGIAMGGAVKTVVWWADGSVRVVLEARL